MVQIQAIVVLASEHVTSDHLVTNGAQIQEGRNIAQAAARSAACTSLAASFSISFSASFGISFSASFSGRHSKLPAQNTFRGTCAKQLIYVKPGYTHQVLVWRISRCDLFLHRATLTGRSTCCNR
jgi:hypothetical protein